ncbi:orcokinin peptides type A-like isoform X2 [Condylostylus longicornis]|uniref:orcokinin peptides type A-like isoform X2 n=1 Tax=Condylostylus longicornis TaxID=2530218 RepID=UPI00244E49BD|nr:orcokinin peptides type A-like isoform X2 [Condylostylus longicornis]
MKSFCVVAFLAIFIGYSFGIPTKVHGYDEYMLQNNLKQLNQNEADRLMAYQRLLEEGRQIGNKIKIMTNHLQRNMINKRNFDEIDRAGFTNVKRNFDEIDRAGFNFVKKDFDEIDAAGFR